MPDSAYEHLTRFFQKHLPFTPNSGQVDRFQADLRLVSPFLMEAALKEVSAGTKGNILVYQPGQWRSAIFEVYNRKVAEHAQLFPVFHSFETAFRSTVAASLERHYQHKRWWRAIFEQMGRRGDLREITSVGNTPMNWRAVSLIRTIIAAIDADGRRQVVEGLQDGYEFLEHCDLGHTGRLIEEHWALFGPMFAKISPLSRADFISQFGRIRDARNDVYHHKSLARMAHVVATAEALLDRLDFCLAFTYEKITKSKLRAPVFQVTAETRHGTW